MTRLYPNYQKQQHRMKDKLSEKELMILQAMCLGESSEEISTVWRQSGKPFALAWCILQRTIKAKKSDQNQRSSEKNLICARIIEILMAFLIVTLL
jgi:hypothetical protein